MIYAALQIPSFKKYFSLLMKKKILMEEKNPHGQSNGMSSLKEVVGLSVLKWDSRSWLTFSLLPFKKDESSTGSCQSLDTVLQESMTCDTVGRGAGKQILHEEKWAWCALILIICLFCPVLFALLLNICVGTFYVIHIKLYMFLVFQQGQLVSSTYISILYLLIYNMYTYHHYYPTCQPPWYLVE